MSLKTKCSCSIPNHSAISQSCRLDLQEMLKKIFRKKGSDMGQKSNLHKRRQSIEKWINKSKIRTLICIILNFSSG